MMFLHPLLALVAIPLLLLLVWLLKKSFVPDTYLDARDRARRSRMRWFLLVVRGLCIVLLVLALMHPVRERTEFLDTNPEITVLIDNSSSMSVLDTSGVDRLIADLDARVPVRVRHIGSGNTSALGDEVLHYLQPGVNLLLVTDGHVTSGATIADVATYAATLNSTLNAVRLKPALADAAVSVFGPSKAVTGTNSTFEVRVWSTVDSPVPVRVFVNDVQVFSGELLGAHAWEQSFPVGQHRIVAVLDEEDAFSVNNRYVHTLTVVEKPRVLYVTRKPSGLEHILSALYSVTTVESLPSDLRPYYAIVLNDLPVGVVSDTAALTRFLVDGNGILVVGGLSSYERGGYASSVFETLLPVRVGAGERIQGGANIAIAIDMSGTTHGSVRYERTETGAIREVAATAEEQSLQKALAVSIIRDLNPTNKVGVLGFTYPTPTATSGCSGACLIQDVVLLGKNKADLIDKVARVDITGGTSYGVGMEGAFELLRRHSGNKNIIFLSDGRIRNVQDEQRAITVAQTVAAQGGRVYAVQVGDSASGAVFLRDLARAGQGIYFPATRANRLSVLFGDPVSIDDGDAFDVFAIDQHHFITEDIDLVATLYGYNQVAPKPGAFVLVTSNAGDPVLTVWSYGVGRVASLTGYNGPDLGELLVRPNSKLLSRSVNWLIGDPERKAAFVVDIPDGMVGEPLRAVVQADVAPSVEGLSFEPIGRSRYAANVRPDEVGEFSLLGASYAVNYPREYRRIGFSPVLADALLVSGGTVFDMDDVEEMITHVKTLQKMTRTEFLDFRWPFLIAALVLFLVDVGVRRVRELRRR